VQGIQKAVGARRALVLFDLHKHPARCPVNRHKQVASRGLISHLRQILDVYVHEARHIVFEGLVNERRGFRFERSQVPHAMAAKASAQTRTRNALIETLASDCLEPNNLDQATGHSDYRKRLALRSRQYDSRSSTPS